MNNPVPTIIVTPNSIPIFVLRDDIIQKIKITKINYMLIILHKLGLRDGKSFTRVTKTIFR